MAIVKMGNWAYFIGRSANYMGKRILNFVCMHGTIMIQWYTYIVHTCHENRTGNSVYLKFTRVKWGTMSKNEGNVPPWPIFVETDLTMYTYCIHMLWNQSSLVTGVRWMCVKTSTLTWLEGSVMWCYSSPIIFVGHWQGINKFNVKTSKFCPGFLLLQHWTWLPQASGQRDWSGGGWVFWNVNSWTLTHEKCSCRNSTIEAQGMLNLCSLLFEKQTTIKTVTMMNYSPIFSIFIWHMTIINMITMKPLRRWEIEQLTTGSLASKAWASEIQRRCWRQSYHIIYNGSLSGKYCYDIDC